MSWRHVDPVAEAERVGWRREGYRSQRDLEQRDDDAQRFDRTGRSRLIVQETFVGFRADVGAGATTSLHVDFRSSTTGVQTQGQGLDVPAQARVLVVRIVASGDVTAGTITPQLTVTEGATTTDYLFSECELSTAQPRRKAARFAWENAVQIAKDAAFQMQLVSSAAYAPTTLDFSMRLVLGYEDWVSS